MNGVISVHLSCIWLNIFTLIFSLSSDSFFDLSDQRQKVNNLNGLLDHWWNICLTAIFPSKGIDSSIIFCHMRWSLHLFVCRLVMYIERDSRKTMPGKEQQSSNEYLSKCLDLLIYQIVQELPQILGKLSCLTINRIFLFTPWL